MSGIHLIPVPEQRRRPSLSPGGGDHLLDVGPSSSMSSSSLHQGSRSPPPSPSPSLAPSPIIPQTSFGAPCSSEHGRHRSSLDGFTSPNIAAPAKRLSKMIFADPIPEDHHADLRYGETHWSGLPSPSPSRTSFLDPSSAAAGPSEVAAFGLGVSTLAPPPIDPNTYSNMIPDLSSRTESVIEFNVEPPAKEYASKAVSGAAASSDGESEFSHHQSLEDTPLESTLPRTTYVPRSTQRAPSLTTRVTDALIGWISSPSSSPSGSLSSGSDISYDSPISTAASTPPRFRYHVFPISPSLLRPHPRHIHGATSLVTKSTRSSKKWMLLVCAALSVLLFYHRTTLSQELEHFESLSRTELQAATAVPKSRPSRLGPLKSRLRKAAHDRFRKAPSYRTSASQLSASDEKRIEAGEYDRILALNQPPRRRIFGPDDSGLNANIGDTKRGRLPTVADLRRQFNTDKQAYMAQRKGWHEFEWRAPHVDASLRRSEATLTDDEFELKRWIRRLHRGITATSVGLARNASQEPLPLESVEYVPELGAMPYLSRASGSIKKWESLEFQAMSPGDGGMCAGSIWMDEYAYMHREILNGDREPRFVSYHCETGMNCGGAADRILGLTSTFLFGLVTNRAFLAEWQSPIPLEVIFDSPRIDWSHSSFNVDSHPVLGDLDLASRAKELDIVNFDRLAMDTTFRSTVWNWQEDRHSKTLKPGFEQRDLALQSPWVKMYTNRGMISRSFHYPTLQPRLQQLGLHPLTAFSCISNYLFKPKPAALDLITSYTSLMELPTVFSVGIQIRTGDESMRNPEHDQSNTVARHSDYFRCARELATTYSLPTQRILYYLVTDSAHLKTDAKRVLGEALVLTDMKPHRDHLASSHHAVDGVMGAVVENWILGKTDMRVTTQDSAFVRGKLAAFASGNNHSTVTLLPRNHPGRKIKAKKGGRGNLDCTKAGALVGFDELSSTGSLG
ncbi:BZ3501_MvSof-1269-A2-R1_Chr1-3g01309 [Microbotryum saponariae]|nr:BZ3501_MvSof-1269-A2-R1_Chr1-3g01309 [Microbotryum saponariae]